MISGFLIKIHYTKFRKVNQFLNLHRIKYIDLGEIGPAGDDVTMFTFNVPNKIMTLLALSTDATVLSILHRIAVTPHGEELLVCDDAGIEIRTLLSNTEVNWYWENTEWI